MSKILNQKVDNSIFLKDNELRQILKNSRVKPSIEKFWEMVFKKLQLSDRDNIDITKVVVSKAFFEKMYESDTNYDNSKDLYIQMSPKVSEELDEEDFEIYLLNGYL